MTIMKRMLAGGAAVAAIAVAAPASAQYAYPYGYNPYAQQKPYASGYGYNNSAYMTQVATQQCTAAVQNRRHSSSLPTAITKSPSDASNVS